jgi:hypothetical protein
MVRGNLQRQSSKRSECARVGIAALMALALVLGICGGVVQCYADDAPSKQSVTLAEYEAELDRITAAVSDLPDHPGGLDALRQSLPSGWTVDAGRQKYEVSANWIAGALQQKGKNASDQKKIWMELAERLKSLRGEAERAKDMNAEVNRADAKARLQQILKQREFNQVKGSSWWSEMWDQVSRWIDWLLDHTLGRLLGNGTARTVVLYTIIGAVFLFAAVWLVRGMRTLARTDALSVSAVFPPGKHWRDWAREASAAASRGDYRAALHSAYWAGVYRMAELGAWKLDRARTPREYLRIIGEQAQTEPVPQNLAGSATALKSLTHGMEASWYGFNPATVEDFENAVTNLETLGCRLHSTAQTAKS